MDQDELSKRIQHLRYLAEQADKPVSAYDPCSGMNDEEVRNYCRFLFGQVQEKDRQLERVLADLSEIKDELKKANAELKALSVRLDSANSLNTSLRIENRVLQERNSLLLQERFGSSRSQKGIGKRKQAKGKDDGKGGFDGTSQSLPSGTPEESSSSSCSEAPADASGKCYHGPSRKGCSYNKEVVGTPILHRSDKSKIPAGATILKTKFKTIRDFKILVEEHRFEMIKIRRADGKIEWLYFPYDGDDGVSVYNDVMPGTHITTNMLSHLVYDRYCMATPSYRQAKIRLADMDWATPRQNLLNWEGKGASILNKLIPALKQLALQKGSNVNVDETWARYQTHYGHRKTYMWCLVNRSAHIAIYFYDDSEADPGGKPGGRGRRVLMDFLGNAELKSLQSDGYNVYMYLDDHLISIDHLCCMAHVRAKFKDALDQGCVYARFFLEMIGKLYVREGEYRRDRLTPEEIKAKRNDAYTNEIVKNLWDELHKLLGKKESLMSDLMTRALNYLHRFWNQVFLYRKDGEYTIDNLEAERSIRPMTVQRKNSLFFCSTQGAVNSAIYNTFIQTCRQVGIPFRDYFRKVIKAIAGGRTDYENLLPMTIPLNE